MPRWTGNWETGTASPTTCGGSPSSTSTARSDATASRDAGGSATAGCVRGSSWRSGRSPCQSVGANRWSDRAQCASNRPGVDERRRTWRRRRFGRPWCALRRARRLDDPGGPHAVLRRARRRTAGRRFALPAPLGLRHARSPRPATSAITDWKGWAGSAISSHTPWGDEDSPAFVTTVESALERELAEMSRPRHASPGRPPAAGRRGTDPPGRSRRRALHHRRRRARGQRRWGRGRRARPRDSAR